MRGRMAEAHEAGVTRAVALRELATLFLRLGTTAFGGPAAHIAMMHDEVVVRRRWLTNEEFLDLLGATNLIPGPNSTEMAIHIGRKRAGVAGLLVAGTCFILPAALLTLAAAWAYVRFGSLPRAQALLYGVKPVIVAVVVQAIGNLAKAALRSTATRVLGAIALVLAFAHVHELAILVGCGAAFGLVRSRPRRGDAAMLGAPLATGAGAAGAIASPAKLFLVFLKIGSVLFGSGYVLLAFLHDDLVDRLHWLTERQLLDAVAVGQVTPGPVFTTATFIGYVVARGPGAAVATLGIFLPSFFFVAATSALIPRIRASTFARAFLDGVNVASLALMVAVTWQLGRAAVFDVATAALAIVSAVAVIRFKVNSAWLVLAGGAIGLALGGA